MASLHTPTDPWLAARSRYMEDLNNEEKEAFATASIENLFYSASAAQKGHKETSRSRAISSKLEPFVGAIDQYGRALDVYSNTYSLVMGPLWGSIRVLLQVAQAFEKYFEKLIDMFSRIGDILPRFQVYQSLFPSHERLLQAISIAYLDIIYFCMDAKKTFRKLKRSTTIYLTLKLVWKDFSKGFEGTLDKFRNHVKNIEKEAGVSNMLEASDEQALARANRAEMERKRKVEERDLMLSQLSSIRYADKHLRERKRRHPGTGTWLTKTLEFKEWKMRDRSACLWCYGIPGSGKTVLASSLIDTLSIDNANKDITIQYLTSHDIISKDITTQELAIAYYYCDFSDPKSLDARNILGTIIRQLLNKIIIPLDLKQQLDQLYRPGIRAAANDELLAILVAVVKHFSKVYIFVDGLDECRKEERFSVLSMINQLTQSECTAVKILITSQEVADVSTSLKGHPRLQISVDKNSSDIASFIEETIKANIKSGALVVHDPSLELNIISALVDGAQGMFLWVSFQIADLCDATSEFEIRETLQNLPKGMAATYARILQKIRSIRANISLAQRIFKWIICAKRPLLIAELTEAIAFGPTDRSWDARKIPDATRSIQACGNLVVFDEDDKTVRLAHHSVRQFLLEPPTQDPISEFHFQLSQANVEAGELCVAYLSFSDFETQLTIPSANILRPASNVPGPVAVLDSVRSSSSLGHVKSGMVNFRQHMRTGSKRQQTPTFDLGEFLKLRKSPPPSLREKYLFLNYAIENWIGHTSNFSEDNTTMWKSFKYLAMDKPMPFDTRSWPDTYVSGGLPYTALFRWAVDAGHVPLLKLLLRLPTGHDIHAYYRQDVDEGRSVVLNASRCGHANVIKLLAQQGCIDDRGGKPLVEAAENGYDFAVRLLLEYGLCLEAKTEALEKAVKSGHAAVTYLLLRVEHEPSLDPQNEWCRRALVEAAHRGDNLLVWLLLEKGTDVEAKDIEGKTALSQAAIYGHETVVQLLLENGANIEAQDWSVRTALHHTAVEGQETVMRLLLEKGANIEAKDRFARTALHHAAMEGQETLVQLLLEKGANIEAEDNIGLTALHHAAMKGQETLVQLLLEKGANIEAKNRNKETALHRAVEFKNETIMRLLLEKGANIEAEDNIGLTALHWATRNGQETVMRLLLEKGANIEATNNVGETALHWAALTNQTDVVRLLLEKGANIEAKTDLGATVLHLTVRKGKGKETVMRLLLEKGANIEAKDNLGFTALLRMAMYGQETVVQLLLEKGANIEAKDDDGFTALLQAAGYGHETVVQLLLEKGANIEAKDDDGFTALLQAAGYGHETVVQLLLEAGADTEARDNHGVSALDLAIRDKHKPVMRLLRSKVQNI